MTTTWNDERLMAALKRYWQDGLSATEIARRLNREFKLSLTRNSVIGKAHRMGWVSGSKTAPKEPKDAPIRQVRVRSQAFTSRPCQEAPPAPEDEGVNLAALRATDPCGCMWPIGDPGQKGFHYCGARRALKRSYCDEHVKIAYQPRAKRKKAKPEALKGFYTDRPGRFAPL